MSEKNDVFEKIVSLAKRRGFVFPSSEIYGGFGAIYDYGHYGTLLKNNIRDLWWKAMVQLRDDVVGLDSAIFMHPMVIRLTSHLRFLYSVHGAIAVGVRKRKKRPSVEGRF